MLLLNYKHIIHGESAHTLRSRLGLENVWLLGQWVDPLAEQLLDELRAQAASNLKSGILRQLESSTSLVQTTIISKHLQFGARALSSHSKPTQNHDAFMFSSHAFANAVAIGNMEHVCMQDAASQLQAYYSWRKRAHFEKPAWP